MFQVLSAIFEQSNQNGEVLADIMSCSFSSSSGADGNLSGKLFICAHCRTCNVVEYYSYSYFGPPGMEK